MSGRPCPILRTSRLTLRGHTLGDHADGLALWGDPAVTRHIGGTPSTAEEVWARLLRYGGLWPLVGHGYWHVSETATGAFVGEVGLADFHRTLPGIDRFAPEAGWAFLPQAQGRGLAGEAVGAMLDWADATLADDRTVCMIAPANSASIRLAQRLGFETFAEATYRGEPTRLFQRARRPAPSPDQRPEPGPA